MKIIKFPSNSATDSTYRRTTPVIHGRWNTFFLLDHHSDLLPHCAGVYAIYFDDYLKYIGSSKNIASRVGQHRIRYGYGKNIHTPWADICSNTVITIKVKPSIKMGQWAMDEIRLIHKLRPEFNCVHGSRPKRMSNGTS